MLQVCTHSVRNSQVPPSLPLGVPPIHKEVSPSPRVEGREPCGGSHTLQAVPQMGESLWAQSLKECTN